MKITRTFENLELTVNVTDEEIIDYLSSLPIKERTDLVRNIFDKDKDNLATNIRNEFDALKLILGFKK